MDLDSSSIVYIESIRQHPGTISRTAIGFKKKSSREKSKLMINAEQRERSILGL